MSELIPCPFCGHVGLDFSEGSTNRWLRYACGGCDMSNEVRAQTSGNGTPAEWLESAKAAAIAEWNRRVSPDAAKTRNNAIMITIAYELEGVIADAERGEFDATCIETLKRVRDALGSAEPVAWPEISHEDREWLRRFADAVEDDKSYDVPKQIMERLADIGLVRHFYGTYGTTEFGDFILKIREPIYTSPRVAMPEDVMASIKWLASGAWNVTPENSYEVTFLAHISVFRDFVRKVTGE